MKLKVNEGLPHHLHIILLCVLPSCFSGLLYRGSIDCLQQTVAKEGFFALYKGFLPVWIRMAPWSLTFWMSFEQIRKTLGASEY